MWPTSVERAAGILQRAMIAVYPQLWQTRVAYAWGGRVAFTMDRMVHVGRAEGLAWVVGCCGAGVATMPWLGTRVAEWLGGGAPPELASLPFPIVPAPYEGRGVVPPARGRVVEDEGPARREGAARRLSRQARRRSVARRRSMSASVVR